MAKGWTLAAVRKNIKVSGVTLAPKRAPKPKPLAQPKSEAALAIAQQKRRINHLKFESFWRQLGGPELKTEQCVVPGRRFSTDYIHEAARVSIELNGGTWSKQDQGHNTGSGIERDAVKQNLVVLAGWTPFVLTAKMLTRTNAPIHLQPIIDFIKMRINQQ